MTGALTITTTTLYNQINITNTSTDGYASIGFFNGTNHGHIGNWMYINYWNLSKKPDEPQQ
jgi:hypothetical protein